MRAPPWVHSRLRASAPKRRGAAPALLGSRPSGGSELLRAAPTIVRLILTATVLAFSSSTAHASLHDLERPSDGSAYHGVACDEAHAEPHCPVCLGKTPQRILLRTPTAPRAAVANAGSGPLRRPGAVLRVPGRAPRADTPRAPPFSG